MLNLRSHGKQHGGCDVRWMNPTLSPRQASPAAGLEKPTGKRQYSHRKITMTLIQTMFLNRITLHAGKQGAHSAKVGALVQVFEKKKKQLLNLKSSKNYRNAKAQYI